MKKIALILASLASLVPVIAMGVPTSADPQFAGIGIQIEITQAGLFVIDKALDGSPAQKVGLQAGDVIEGVQASAGTAMVSLQGKSLEQAVDLIRGPVGVEETLMIKRGESEFTVSAVRQPVNS